MKNHILRFKIFSFVLSVWFLIFIFGALINKTNALVPEFEQELTEEELLVEENKVLLEPPIITEIPKKLEPSDSLTVKGTSVYPNIIVRVFIQGANDQLLSKDIIADKEGKWIYFYNEQINEGDYLIWAMVVDNQGNQSLFSEKFSLTIVSRPLFEILKGATLVIILLLIIIVMLGLFVFYQKRKILLKKKLLKRETEKTEKIITKVFSALQEETREQVFEKEIYGKLKEALDISESFIKKEIKDIKKKLD